MEGTASVRIFIRIEFSGGATIINKDGSQLVVMLVSISYTYKARERQMKTMKLFAYMIIWSVFVTAAPRNSSAQDTHYWNNQYGPRSILLGGAVIGSVTDMSATFYNPGALGYIKKPELLLSANAYQLETLNVQDGGGDGIDLSSSQFNLLPNMLAGAFKKSWLGNNKLAYSFLTRHRFDAEVKGSASDRLDILPEPGDEEFAGVLRAGAGTQELWAGVTWARAVNPTIGVGVTTYLSFRSEEGVSEILAQALTDSGDMALVFNIDNFSSSVYSLLWKAGVGVNLHPLTFGLTVTTPNVRLFGSGEAMLNSSVVGVDLDGDDIPDNAFQTNLQQDVKANYKSPWAVGFGAGYFLKHTQFHISAEWYDAVDSYAVLELEGFTSQTTGEVVDRSIRQKRDDVINFAIGARQDFGERYGGFLSFSTDKSSFNKESDISVTSFDIYHLTGGGSAAFGKTNWMLGISYAWGSEQTSQLIDLEPGDSASAADQGNQVDLNYSRVTFMVGFRVAL